MAFQDRVGMHYAGFRKDTADIGFDEQEKIRKNPAIKTMNTLTAMAGGATPMIEMAKKFQGPGMEAKGKYKKWFKEEHGKGSWRKGAEGVQAGKFQWREKKNEFIKMYLDGVTTWDVKTDPKTEKTETVKNDKPVPAPQLNPGTGGYELMTNEDLVTAGIVDPNKDPSLLGQGASEYAKKNPVPGVKLPSDIDEIPELGVDLDEYKTEILSYGAATEKDSTLVVDPTLGKGDRVGDTMHNEFLRKQEEKAAKKEEGKSDSELTQSEWEAKYWGKIGKSNPYEDDWYWGKMWGRKDPSGVR